jgi:cytoskeletal protein CcmA (bactofilin family)
MSKFDKTEAESKRTTVEEGSELKGTLQSSCQVVVRGLVDGVLTAPSLVISESGTVIGNVKAQSIQSAGTLAGRIEADDIQLSGSVRSDTVIRAKTLEVRLRANDKPFEITFGECSLEIGDDPNLEPALSTPASRDSEKRSAALDDGQDSKDSAAQLSVPQP